MTKKLSIFAALALFSLVTAVVFNLAPWALVFLLGAFAALAADFDICEVDHV